MSTIFYFGVQILGLCLGILSSVFLVRCLQRIGSSHFSGDGSEPFDEDLSK